MRDSTREVIRSGDPEGLTEEVTLELRPKGEPITQSAGAWAFQVEGRARAKALLQDQERRGHRRPAAVGLQSGGEDAGSWEVVILGNWWGWDWAGPGGGALGCSGSWHPPQAQSLQCSPWAACVENLPIPDQKSHLQKPQCQTGVGTPQQGSLQPSRGSESPTLKLSGTRGSG